MMTALCILLAGALLGLLISRVHFHFHFTLQVSRSPKATQTGNTNRERRKETRPAANLGGGSRPAVRSIADPAVTSAIDTAKQRAEDDLISALVNLGCKPGKALQIASQAMKQADDFDGRLRWAIQKAA